MSLTPEDMKEGRDAYVRTLEHDEKKKRRPILYVGNVVVGAISLVEYVAGGPAWVLLSFIFWILFLTFLVLRAKREDLLNQKDVELLNRLEQQSGSEILWE
jgi:hypothetical protein